MKTHSFFVADASPEETFAFVASADAMMLFSGWGVVPAIRQVEFLGDGFIEVRTGRSWHQERVTGARPSKSLTIDIYPKGLLGLVCPRARETWLMREAEEDTRVERHFLFEPRRFCSAALSLLLPLWKRAVEKNNQAIQLALAEKAKPEKPFPEDTLFAFKAPK